MKRRLQFAIALVAAAFAASLSCSQARPSGAVATSAAGATTVIDFEKYDARRTPDDFTPALTGGGGAVSWIVQEDATAPAGKKVLAQTSTDDTDYRFPIC